jgi:hypothetical protein
MIAARLDLPLPKEAQGGIPPAVDHPIAAEVYPLPFTSGDGDWRALYRGPYKLVWNSLGNHELFELDSDPDESANLIEERRELAEELLAELGGFFGGLPPAPELNVEDTEVDPETLETLKSLGYVN